MASLRAKDASLPSLPDSGQWSLRPVLVKQSAVCLRSRDVVENEETIHGENETCRVVCPPSTYLALYSNRVHGRLPHPAVGLSVVTRPPIGTSFPGCFAHRPRQSHHTTRPRSSSRPRRPSWRCRLSGSRRRCLCHPVACLHASSRRRRGRRRPRRRPRR